MHIDTVLKEIAKTVLISLPESSATKVEDMLSLNETYTKEWAEVLNHKKQRKHVAFGSEMEEGENTDYETHIVSEVDVNNKEDEFKKVFIVKQPYAVSQNYDS
ncbi:Dynein heavy chain 8; axonemal [Camelus dromedarius]|uniref:Dynein heavy chain 8 n=1 Tax=Camelus dromedarius TaxID=9838 RepID=A0A5N4CR67_CAMDR|nr:Dynein heavy chain 8; axonemal [Camelus dromedarius]